MKISLKSVNIPQTVKSLGSQVFNGCVSLENVVLSESITSMGASVFYQCIKLKNITLSNNLSYMGNTSFYNCSSVNIEGKTGESDFSSVGENAFQGTNVNYLGNN